MNRRGIYIKEDIIFGILMIIIYTSYSVFSLTTSLASVTLLTNSVRGILFLSILIILYRLVSFKSLYCNRVLLSSSLMLLVFYFLSLFYEYQSGFNNTSIGTGLHYMAFPIIVVIGLVNSMNDEQLYNLMVVILLITFLAYIFEIIISGNLSLSAIKSISIKDSYSPFESHHFSGISISLGAYFSYYRKNKKWTAFSFIFSIMTFKRIPILFAVILLLLPVVKKDLTIKRANTLAITMTIIFSLLGIGYAFIMMPQNIIIIDVLSQQYLGLSVTELLMSRNVLLERLLESGFVRSGIDSTFLFSRDIEMDLVRIFLELGAVGVFITVYYYWSIAKRNLFAFIYMFSIMINLLVSHSIHSPYGWILKYILFFSIIKDFEKEQKNVDKER